MRSVRFITWNCRSGSIDHRMAQLAEYRPDVVFLQECVPAVRRPCTYRVNAQKGIALVCASPGFRLSALARNSNAGRASVAASVVGDGAFSVVGIWGQLPNYVADVLRTLEAHARRLRRGRTIVMGDFNSGVALRGEQSLSVGHRRILDTCSALGLASAYHAFHRIEHASEKHATYYHQFKLTQPWHIDYCFVPTSWLAGVRSVQVLDGDTWASHSDHRPLIVDVVPPQG